MGEDGDKRIKKQVAIIGSGCSGLAAIKTCMDEGLNPVCFESSDDIGGLWRFISGDDDVEDGRGGSVASTTIMNTSKEMMAFSDFPPPKDFPNFMHHTKVLEYYRLYAERFQLRKHIRFNTKVEFVQQNISHCKVHDKDKPLPNTNNENATTQTNGNISTNHVGTTTTTANKCDICTNQSNDKSDTNSNTTWESDFNQNCIKPQTTNYNDDDGDADNDEKDEISRHLSDHRKTWTVHTQNTLTGKASILYFDYVLVCTGHHAFINMPTIPGQVDFKGRIIHSRDLREPDKLKAGARHVVVGVGNSGCDMAVEISKKSKVFLSTRRGTWLMHRLQAKGLPADISFSNRLVFATAFSLPDPLLNALSARHLNQKIDHDLYGLRPHHGPIAAHPTVNDELPNRIACGRVVVKPNIHRLDGKKVYFDDGTVCDDIDTVIMATGYHIKYPFLDESILSSHDSKNDNSLYLYMFPPTSLRTSPHSLAIIGCVQPGGALAPVSEMQCRLAVKVFKSDVKLPSQPTINQDIAMKRGAMRNRYVNTPRHTVQVDYIPYMDQLASLIGCKPKLGRMLIQDPGLAMKCIIGPCTAYQYRLQGPERWGKAREAIVTQMDRVVYPLKTRKCVKDTDYLTSLFFFGLFLICVIFGMFYSL